MVQAPSLPPPSRASTTPRRSARSHALGGDGLPSPLPALPALQNLYESFSLAVLSLFKASVPNLFGTRDGLRGSQFFRGMGGGNSSGEAEASLTPCCVAPFLTGPDRLRSAAWGLGTPVLKGLTRPHILDAQSGRKGKRCYLLPQIKNWRLWMGRGDWSVGNFLPP